MDGDPGILDQDKLEEADVEALCLEAYQLKVAFRNIHSVYKIGGGVDLVLAQRKVSRLFELRNKYDAHLRADGGLGVSMEYQAELDQLATLFAELKSAQAPKPPRLRLLDLVLPKVTEDDTESWLPFLTMLKELEATDCSEQEKLIKLKQALPSTTLGIISNMAYKEAAEEVKKRYGNESAVLQAVRDRIKQATL